MTPKPDPDPQETQEWLDALNGVIASRGPAARALPDRAADRQGAARARTCRSRRPPNTSTPSPRTGAESPATRRSSTVRSFIALERVAMVLRAKQGDPRRPHLQLRLGRHPLRRRLQPFLARAVEPPTAATCSSSRAMLARHLRALLPRRPHHEAQLDNFRQEVDGHGVSSYPHPWLMPDYWQFPTVSMGLGPLWRSTRRAS